MQVGLGPSGVGLDSWPGHTSGVVGEQVKRAQCFYY